MLGIIHNIISTKFAIKSINLIIDMKTNNRRKFLKKLSFASIGLSIINPLGKQLFGFNKTPSWIDLLEVAKWCPTIHNLQPQKLKIISKDEAHLYYDPTRLLPYGDPDSVFATVAMGVFIEHLSISAGDYGYLVNIDEIFDDISVNKKEDTLFAILKLKKSNKKESIKSALIKKRRTSRLKYDNIVVKENILNELKKEAQILDNNFYYTQDKKLINSLKKINQEALFEDLANDNIRKELDSLFRYKKKYAELKKDGLWAKCMGFGGDLLSSVFQNHEKWTKGLPKIILRNTYMSSFSNTKTICWYRSSFENTIDYINNGRMFARSWLHLTNHNLYMHPFGSLVTNASAHKKIKSIFYEKNNYKPIWMIYRIGYSKTPARSYRKETNDFLI